MGKYQLLKRLAVGGMAEIYLARSSGTEGFEKTVALKRILPQHAANDEFIQMFLNEARLAATLHHPNIAQTYDIGTDGGSYFFTMEYVHGEDMRQILKTAGRTGKGLPLEHAINVVLGICGGLHHAHQKVGADGRMLGIVHRDVSPSNVLITYDGAVKLVDFGIAKATTHRAETRVGTLKGKIAYMSPEQCRGERLDRRSDIFSIGILLYEFTTGVRLYKADNEFAILSLIVNEDVTPPSRLRPDYPPALEQIVMRALKRDRDQRYATAEEMQSDLENFARDNRLATSSIALGRYMESLFGRKPDPAMEIAQGSVDLPLLAPPETGVRKRAPSTVETNPLRRAGDLVDVSGSGMLAAEAASLLPRRRFWPGVLAAGGAVAAIALTAFILAAPQRSSPVSPVAPAAAVPEVEAPPPAPMLVPVPMPPAMVAPASAEPPAVAIPEPAATPAVETEVVPEEPERQAKKRRKVSKGSTKKDEPAVSAPVEEKPAETPVVKKKNDLDSLFPPE